LSKEVKYINPQSFKDIAKRIGAISISLLLVVLDLGLRALTGFWRWLLPLLPTTGRLAAIGALTGGVVVGAGMVVARFGSLVDASVSLAMVGAVWGVAVLLWAIAALMYMVLKTSATMLGGIIYKLTDIGNRPTVAQDMYRSTISDLGDPSGGVRQPKPTFRDPGSFKSEGDSSFVPYSDEDGRARELVAQMRSGGIDEKEIADMLAEFQKQK